MQEIILGGVILFLGGVVQGLSGFGLSLTTVPLMVSFVPPVVLTPVQVLVSLVNNVAVSYEARRRIDWRQVWPLVAGGIVGIPLGIYLLKSLDSAWIKAGIGAIVVGIALFMLSGWTPRLPQKFAVMLPTGLVSGILGGSTSLNGPPVIIFLASQRQVKDAFRASIAAYFVSVNLVGTAMFFAGGMLTGRVLLLAGVWTLFVIAGTITGIRLAKRVNEQLFRRAVLVLLALAGVLLVAANVSVVL
ncbi:sulfite exporter TauE/SafE family protein [bacterium]|nr:sulfite exporter TauE/SafE family protein [bacterium]